MCTFRVELTDPDAHDRLADELRRADLVFHLAGRAGVRDCGPEVDSARRRDNGLAAVTVLGLTPPTTPLLVTSSSSVYGGAAVRAGRRVPVARVRSRPSAGRVRPFEGARGAPVRAAPGARRAGHGGPPVHRGRARVSARTWRVSRWLQAALDGAPAHVLGSLERRRDMTDVRQVARALADLAAHPDLDIVNIGTGTTAPPRRRALGRRRRGGPAGRDRDRARIPGGAGGDAVPTPARLEQRLGWVPETDLDELVRAQLASRDGLALAGRECQHGLALRHVEC